MHAGSNKRMGYRRWRCIVETPTFGSNCGEPGRSAESTCVGFVEPTGIGVGTKPESGNSTDKIRSVPKRFGFDIRHRTSVSIG